MRTARPPLVGTTPRALRVRLPALPARPAVPALEALGRRTRAVADAVGSPAAREQAIHVARIAGAVAVASTAVEMVRRPGRRWLGFGAVSSFDTAMIATDPGRFWSGIFRRTLDRIDDWKRAAPLIGVLVVAAELAHPTPRRPWKT
jgi:threonine dehydrogenase-like Zn-dependent dehydrogenase